MLVNYTRMVYTKIEVYYMKRIDLHVTETQNKWLEEQSGKMEISKSELMRRIIDKERKKKQ